jgi:hypothetical protein
LAEKVTKGEALAKRDQELGRLQGRDRRIADNLHAGCSEILVR